MIRVTTFFAIAVAAGTACAEPLANNVTVVVRTPLEKLTSYPTDKVTPLDRPDATNPELLKQLPRDQFVTVKLTSEPGGSIREHQHRFIDLNRANARIEVLGTCASACTVVMSYTMRGNICFGPDATLKFHQAQNGDLSFNYDATNTMYQTYPADIRKWIDSQGGIPKNGSWLYLYADELWKMGYAKCSPG